MRTACYIITFTIVIIIIATLSSVTAAAARTFIILLLCGFTDFVRSPFLTVAQYNESHNHYCPKVSCSNPLLFQMTFPFCSSPTISISPFPCSNYTLFIWPPGCPLMQRRGIIKMIYRCNPPTPPPPIFFSQSLAPPSVARHNITSGIKICFD